MQRTGPPQAHPSHRGVSRLGQYEHAALLQQDSAPAAAGPPNAEAAKQRGSPAHPSLSALRCAAQGQTRPSLPSASLRGGPAGLAPLPSRAVPRVRRERRTHPRRDGYRHTRHDRPWEVVASQRLAKRIFSSIAVPSSAQRRTATTLGQTHPPTRPREAPRTGREKPAAPAPPSHTRGNARGPRLPSHPGPAPDEGKVSRLRSPLPGTQPARRQRPYRATAARLPARHRAGMLLRSLEKATCWAGSARRGRGCAGRSAAPASRGGTGHRQLPPARRHRSLHKPNPAAAQSPQARSCSALPPLSPARSLPPLGGSARTRRSTQRATAAQDTGTLAGSYRERRHCSIAKRLSPAARSLPSSPPARRPPAPAGSAAAAGSRRRPPPGRAGSASSLRDRPGPAARRDPAASPRRQPPPPAAAAPAAPPRRPAEERERSPTAAASPRPGLGARRTWARGHLRRQRPSPRRRGSVAPALPMQGRSHRPLGEEREEGGRQSAAALTARRQIKPQGAASPGRSCRWGASRRLRVGAARRRRRSRRAPRGHRQRPALRALGSAREADLGSCPTPVPRAGAAFPRERRGRRASPASVSRCRCPAAAGGERSAGATRSAALGALGERPEAPRVLRRNRFTSDSGKRWTAAAQRGRGSKRSDCPLLLTAA